MGTRGLRPRAQAKHRARAPPVPYPPPGWTPARLLGARRPPWSVPLRSLEGDVRRGPAVHARIAGDQLADVLWAAARAAAAAPGGNVERHLWATGACPASYWSPTYFDLTMIPAPQS